MSFFCFFLGVVDLFSTFKWMSFFVFFRLCLKQLNLNYNIYLFSYKCLCFLLELLKFQCNFLLFWKKTEDSRYTHVSFKEGIINSNVFFLSGPMFNSSTRGFFYSTWAKIIFDKVFCRHCCKYKFYLFLRE